MHAREVLAALLTALALAAAPGPARAAESNYASYITPFPATDRYRLYLFGDSLAAGLAPPLTADLAPQSIEVINKTAPGLGLARSDGTEWDKLIDTLPPSESFQIAVVMIGADDRAAMKLAKQWAAPGTPVWQQEYTRRIDAVLKALRGRKAAIYWLGLPIMRGPLATASVKNLNGLFLERVQLNGAKYLESWNSFVDADGAYADFGPDVTGVVKQLRLQDGVHTTIAGSQKLASLIEREIGHDLAIAKRERDVPLAGDEGEQQNVRDASLPRAEGSSAAAIGSALKSVKKVKDYPADDGSIVAPGADGAPANITIVRPPIPGAVVAQILSSRNAPQQELGHTMPTDLKGGFTVLSSIATSLEGNAKLKQHIPLTENPFYKLLIRGDGLPPRPGRVDDFSWPRAGG